LVAFNKQGDKSYESGAKYLFNAVFSSAIFLMGISFIYGISGSLYFDDIAASASTNTALFIVALAFFMAVVMGVLTNIPAKSVCVSPPGMQLRAVTAASNTHAMPENHLSRKRGDANKSTKKRSMVATNSNNSGCMYSHIKEYCDKSISVRL
jgi:hypothetical protein